MPRGQIFEENEYGEMKPSENNNMARDLDGNPLQPAHIPRGVVYNENEFGEIDEGHQNTIQENPRESLGTAHSSDFGADTEQRSEAFRSEQVYPENRFGELGRADTSVETPKPSTSDKVKGKRKNSTGEHLSLILTVVCSIGTAEQLIGKVIGNKELHDKGVARKVLSLFSDVSTSRVLIVLHFYRVL